MIHDFPPIHDSRRLLITYLFNDVLIGYLMNGKTGNKKRAICFATWLQNELNSDVARFTIRENKHCNLISCKTGSNVVRKIHNIAIQLGLQQCCKTSCTFFVTRFTAALVLFCIVSLVFKRLFSSRIMYILDHCFSVSSFILSSYGVFL